MKLLQELIQLTESKSFIRKWLNAIIKKVDDMCTSDKISSDGRYKDVEIRENEQVIEWVTQQGGEQDVLNALKTEMEQVPGRFAGWTIKVVVRDEWRGNSTKWLKGKITS